MGGRPPREMVRLKTNVLTSDRKAVPGIFTMRLEGDMGMVLEQFFSGWFNW